MLSALIIRPVNNAAWNKHDIAGHNLVNLVVYEIIAVAVHHIVYLVKIVIMMRVHYFSEIRSDIKSESGIFGKFERCHFFASFYVSLGRVALW